MTTILKYNAGNVFSVQNALRQLGEASIVTDDPEQIRSAERVIFPGVGEASSAMRYLREKGLDEVIRSLQQPFLGICLGMQLMCRHSEENDTACLGVFDTVVKLFPPKERVPHMGWNSLQASPTPLLKNLPEDADFYFVHSYYAESNEDTVATCDYIQPFAAIMQRDNFYGTQFHPEKSATVGRQLLKNFLQIF